MAASFRGNGSYEGWLLRIAWRQFLSRARNARQQSAELHDQEQATQADPASALDIHRALASLTSDERAAALLCLGEGYSHSEAARTLDLPLGTLKSIVSRARTKLANHMRESENGG